MSSSEVCREFCSACSILGFKPVDVTHGDLRRARGGILTIGAVTALEILGETGAATAIKRRLYTPEAEAAMTTLEKTLPLMREWQILYRAKAALEKNKTSQGVVDFCCAVRPLSQHYLIGAMKSIYMQAYDINPSAIPGSLNAVLLLIQDTKRKCAEAGLTPSTGFQRALDSSRSAIYEGKILSTVIHNIIWDKIKLPKNWADGIHDRDILERLGRHSTTDFRESVRRVAAEVRAGLIG